MVFDLPSSDGCWWELPQRRVPTYIKHTVRFCIEGRVSKVSSEYLLTSWGGSAGREGEAATALFGVLGVFDVSSTTPCIHRKGNLVKHLHIEMKQ